MAKNLSLQPENISAEIAQLLKDLQTFEFYGKMRDYSIKGYTEDSLREFLKLSESVRNQKARQLQDSVGILLKRSSLLSNEGAARSKVTRTEELDCIRAALEEYNLESSDDLEFVKEGQVVEMYDSAGIQIYRNLEFCKQCGYDLLTLCLYQWYELYERSDAVTNSLFGKVAEVFKGSQITVPFETPAHTMRQKHLNLKKVFYISPGHVSPLLDRETKAVKAVLTTLGSVEIQEPGAADKIVHLKS